MVEINFDMEAIAGISGDDFSNAVKEFTKSLERANRAAKYSDKEAQLILGSSLCILVAKLHERVVYLEQFAPVKMNYRKDDLQ